MLPALSLAPLSCGGGRAQGCLGEEQAGWAPGWKCLYCFLFLFSFSPQADVLRVMKCYVLFTASYPEAYNMSVHHWWCYFDHLVKVMIVGFWTVNLLLL